jgi:hypothetical protein
MPINSKRSSTNTDIGSRSVETPRTSSVARGSTAVRRVRGGPTNRGSTPRYIAKEHDGWEPRNAFEHGEADFETPEIQLNLGRLDTA